VSCITQCTTSEFTTFVTNVVEAAIHSNARIQLRSGHVTYSLLYKSYVFLNQARSQNVKRQLASSIPIHHPRAPSTKDTMADPTSSASRKMNKHYPVFYGCHQKFATTSTTWCLSIASLAATYSSGTHTISASPRLLQFPITRICRILHYEPIPIFSGRFHIVMWFGADSTISGPCHGWRP
jgi:hypothetical protein